MNFTQRRRFERCLADVFEHSIEYSSEHPGFVSCALDLPDIETLLGRWPEEVDAVHHVPLSDMTASLIDFCGCDGVVSGEEEIAIVEETARALEVSAAQLRAAIKRGPMASADTDS